MTIVNPFSLGADLQKTTSRCLAVHKYLSKQLERLELLLKMCHGLIATGGVEGASETLERLTFARKSLIAGLVINSGKMMVELYCDTEKVAYAAFSELSDEEQEQRIAEFVKTLVRELSEEVQDAEPA